jgi:hypothetical protein
LACSGRYKARRPADAEPGHVRAVINLKMAEALGVTIPTTLLATTAEVIE